MKVDLHVHSAFSDGKIKLEPNIIEMFSDYELVSFTDHEYIFDPSQYYFCTPKKFVSGVELCCNHNGHNIEILAYNFDPTNESLVSLVNKIRDLRINVIENILEKNSILRDSLPSNPFRMNVPLPETINRHNFWEKYNDDYKSACHSVSAEIVINTIISAGGIPVLAHPLESLKGKSEEYIERFIDSLNIKTVELITPKHNNRDIQIINNIIDRINISSSIGSDSHGLTLTNIPFEYDINIASFDWIKTLIYERY